MNTKTRDFEKKRKVSKKNEKFRKKTKSFEKKRKVSKENEKKRKFSKKNEIHRKKTKSFEKNRKSPKKNEKKRKKSNTITCRELLLYIMINCNLEFNIAFKCFPWYFAKENCQ